jgi:O-antigen/teichoic acid export membrane protein
MKALSLVRLNIIANYSGRAWTSLLSLAFVPLYIKLMGVEVYGLLGIFMSLGALLSLLDMGLSATLSRELSRLSTIDNSAQETRNLVRTFELIYWGTGIVIGVAVTLLAPLIARYWINAGKVDRDTVEYALMVMGMSIAFQWPGGLYSGGLMGLQRQVALNVIRSAMVTVQHVGAVLILLLVSPTILAFFFWQSFVGLLTTIALGIWVWKSLAESNTAAKFKRELLLKNWRFATGMTGISLITILLTQLDKIVLSKMLSLEVFGYYMLAFNVANNLNNFSTPIYSALFPKFTQLVASGDTNGLISLYHKGARLLSALMLPVAMTVIFFSKEILGLWLNNPVVSENTQPILVLLIIGTAMSTVMVMPYALQLAHGWTRFSIYKNLIAVPFLVPLLLVLVDRYQGIGAALVWLILNLGYLLFEVPIMHRRLLRTEMRNWYQRDIIQPLLLVGAVVLCFYMTMPNNASRLITISWILLTLMSSFVVSTWTSGHLNFTRLKAGTS